MAEDIPLSRWVEVDLDALAHNARLVKASLRPGTKLLAVVKADGYGCGAVEAAGTFLETGAEMLAVTTLDEGLELRRAGITAPVLLLAPLWRDEYPPALAAGLTVSVAAVETLEWLLDAVENYGAVRLHIKVETGMGRTGLLPEEVPGVVRRLRNRPGVVIEGIYTHLATAAGSDRDYVLEQYRRFEEALQLLQEIGEEIPLRHVCNSAAILKFPELHLDLVRAGTILYGQLPAPELKGWLPLADPWKLKARIIHLRQVTPGTSIGYARLYRTSRPTRIAVIPLGYVEGIGLEPQLRPTGAWDLLKVLAKNILAYLGISLGRSMALVGGRPAPLVGKIAMQLAMLDVGHLSNIHLGSVVEMRARRTTINALLPRVYIKEGKLVKIKGRIGPLLVEGGQVLETE